MENLYNELLGYLKLEDKENALKVSIQAFGKGSCKCNLLI